MIIYENFSFEGKYCSEVSTRYLISETCIFSLGGVYESGLESFKLNSFIKRGDFKRNKIKKFLINKNSSKQK